MRWRRRARIAGTLLALWSAACSSGTGPSPANQLASALDDLTRQANGEGDLDAGAAFSSAAMEIRFGVVPSPLILEVNGVTAEFFGIVHEVMAGRTGGGSPLKLRTLVAVDRVDRPEQILYVAVLADSGALGPPTVPLEQRADLDELAWGSWRDLRSGERWAAPAGRAGIVETSTGGICPGVRLPTPTGCVSATFDVSVDGELWRLGAGSQSSPRQVTFRATSIHGAELTLATP